MESSWYLYLLYVRGLQYIAHPTSCNIEELLVFVLGPVIS